ncbi:hypothetical protein ACFQJD_02985 [Haloplanus sp. GCM10025708]|uniref:hypothetical protein n=1 Tax=Haloplanus sp. GCM10025708 TaxID=3252679 RepID=UPI00361839B2
MGGVRAEDRAVRPGGESGYAVGPERRDTDEQAPSPVEMGGSTRRFALPGRPVTTAPPR